jgi:hypothetical protein
MTTPQFNFYGDISLKNNKLKDVVLESTTAPGSPINGQIFFDSSLQAPTYYSSSFGDFVPMSSLFSLLIGETLAGEALVIGNGASITFTSNGTVNANRYNGAAVVDVQYGGTNRASLQTGAILFGDGTNAIGVDSTGLYYDATNKRLAIRNATASGVFHVGTGAGPLAYIAPMHLTTAARENTVEFNGTGLFFTDNFGVRYQVATTGMSLTALSGILPITRGGTSSSSLASGFPLVSNGSAIVSTNSFPEWNIHNPSGYTVSLNYINGSGNAFFRFPRSTGYIATSRVPYTTGFAYWNGTGILIATGVGFTLPSNIAYTNIDNVLVGQTFKTTASFGSGVGVRFGDGTNTAYVTLYNQGTDTDYSAIFPTKSDGLTQTLMVTRSAYSSGHFVRFNGSDFIAASGTESSGSVTTPGGVPFELQVNSGTFIGATGLTWNNATKNLKIGVQSSVNANCAISQSAGRDYALTTYDSGGNAIIAAGTNGTYLAAWNSADLLLSAYGGSRVRLGDPETGANNTELIIDDSNTFMSFNKEFRMMNANGDAYCSVLGPTDSNSSTFRLPDANGSNKYILTTDGAGNTYWNENSLSNITNDVVDSTATSGQVLTFNGTLWRNANPSGGGSSITNNQKLRSITATFVGTPISSGQTSFTRVPYSGTIQKWSILGTPTGSLQLNVYCTGFAAWPTTSSIAAASLPIISSSRKAEDSVLTGWRTAVASGDVIDVTVASGNNLISQLTFIMDILVT